MHRRLAAQQLHVAWLLLFLWSHWSYLGRRNIRITHGWSDAVLDFNCLSSGAPLYWGNLSFWRVKFRDLRRCGGFTSCQHFLGAGLSSSLLSLNGRLFFFVELDACINFFRSNVVDLFNHLKSVLYNHLLRIKLLVYFNHRLIYFL